MSTGTIPSYASSQQDAGSSNDTMNSTVRQESRTSTAGEETTQTTMTTQIELPQEEEDVRQILLSDFDRCLTRQDQSLENLLLIHRNQQSALRKIKVNIEMANKRENQQKKKSEELNKTIEKLEETMGKESMAEEEANKKKAADLTARIEKFKKAVDDSNGQLQEKREKNKELERKCDTMKAKLKEMENAKQRNEVELARLAHEVDETKAEITEIMQSIIAAVDKFNRSAETDYNIHPDCEAADEVKNVLDEILRDVIDIVDDKKKLDEENEKLKQEIKELEDHVRHAEKMKECFDIEAKNLLEIGYRKGAEKVNKQNYTEILQFVQTTFDEMLKGLKGELDNAEKNQQEISDLEKEEQRKEKDFDQEMKTKKAKIEKTRKRIEEISAQNDQLRNNLKDSTKPSTTNETETITQIKLLKEIRERAERQERLNMENRLKRATAKKEDSARQMKTMNQEVKDLNEKLRRKEEELKDLMEIVDVEREKDAKESRELQKQVEMLAREVDQLEKQLTEIQRRSINEIDQSAMKEAVEELNRAEKELLDEIKDLEKKGKQAENEKAKLIDEFNRLSAESAKYVNQLRKHELANDDMQDELANAENQVKEAEKRLRRERERGRELERMYREQQPVIEPEPIEFVQTTKFSYKSSSSRMRPSSSTTATDFKEADLSKDVQSLVDNRSQSAPSLNTSDFASQIPSSEIPASGSSQLPCSLSGASREPSSRISDRKFVILQQQVQPSSSSQQPSSSKAPSSKQDQTPMFSTKSPSTVTKSEKVQQRNETPQSGNFGQVLNILIPQQESQPQNRFSPPTPKNSPTSLPKTPTSIERRSPVSFGTVTPPTRGDQPIVSSQNRMVSAVKEPSLVPSSIKRSSDVGTSSANQVDEYDVSGDIEFTIEVNNDESTSTKLPTNQSTVSIEEPKSSSSSSKKSKGSRK